MSSFYEGFEKAARESDPLFTDDELKQKARRQGGRAGAITGAVVGNLLTRGGGHGIAGALLGGLGGAGAGYGLHRLAQKKYPLTKADAK